MNTPKEPFVAIHKNTIALFIDGDNFSFSSNKLSVTNLIHALSPWGNVAFRYVFSRNFENNKDLIAQFQAEKFQMCAVKCSPKQKNGVDIRLTIGVMETLLRHPNIKAFIIATSDSDFVPLIHRLQQYQKIVLGIGNKRSSSSLINSCDSFFFYEDLIAIYSQQKRQLLFPITEIKTGLDAFKTILRKKSIYPPTAEMRKKIFPYMYEAAAKLSFPCKCTELQNAWLKLADSIGISRTIVRNIFNALIKGGILSQELELPFLERTIENLPSMNTMEETICNLQLCYIMETKNIIFDPIAICKVIWGDTKKVHEVENILRKGKRHEISR